MNSSDKNSKHEKMERLVELAGQYSYIGNDQAEEAVSLCLKLGTPAIKAVVDLMEKDIKNRIDSDNSHCSENAAFVLGKVGKMSIPTLSSSLKTTSSAHRALGIVARFTEDEDVKKEAIDILKGELKSSDWMRVEAAVRGLGISKDKSVIPTIEELQRSTSNFEVMRACDNAIQNLS